MKKKQLGSSDIYISPIVFGGNVFGWTADETQSFELIDAFIDSGFNMIDTANQYSVWVPGHVGGESETVIGNWLNKTGKRNQVVIATKVGNDMGDGSKGLSKAYILKQADDSLKRLQTDYIDVYYAHKDDENTPFEETLEAYKTLIKAGKVRYIASSNYEAKRLEQMLAFAKENGLPQFIAHQPEYNLFDRQGYEQELEGVCVAQGLSVVTYFSLASGFLSGKYRTKQDLEGHKRGIFVERYMNERGMNILKALDEVSRAKAVPPAVLSIAWILNRASVTAPIVSATTIDQLNQLTSAVDLKLSDEEMRILNKASEY
jgi:aryl-alcohol dehydrogenase-like predicted oxidoreductase